MNTVGSRGVNENARLGSNRVSALRRTIRYMPHAIMASKTTDMILALTASPNGNMPNRLSRYE